MTKSEKIARVLTHVFLIFVALGMIVPFAWMVLTSFKTVSEATQMQPFHLLPKVFNVKITVK